MWIPITIHEPFYKQKYVREKYSIRIPITIREPFYKQKIIREKYVM